MTGHMTGQLTGTKEDTMPITVWTKPNCMQCKATERTLDRSGVPYDRRDLTDPKWRDQVDKFKAQGFTSAPIVQSSQGTFAGFQPDKLQPAIDHAKTELASNTMTGMEMTGPTAG